MSPKPPEPQPAPTAESRETVSVVICAYAEERWDDLLAAVDSVSAQRTPALETILVIDHNGPLLRRVQAARPDARTLANAEGKGLSGARNTGVRAARGSIVAFLDDDARADSAWLERMLDRYVDPAVVGVGGRVEPEWVGARPGWFPPEFDWVVGCSYRGLPEQAQPVRNMIGANMSLRRSVFDAVGGFREGIGRVGKRPLGCEETELCIRARRRLPGATILFEPRASVIHRVPAERGSWSYYRARCYAEGLSKAAVASLAGTSDALSSERAHLVRTLPRGVLCGVRDALLRRDPSGLGRALAIAAGLGLAVAGYARGRLLRWPPLPAAQGAAIAQTTAGVAPVSGR
jgi:glucosyl-dolichyl phosphate glucuronosyltransferase